MPPAPLIATALLADYDSSTPIALYVIAAVLITVLAVVCAEETRHRNLADVDPDAGQDTHAEQPDDAVRTGT